jgi:hypothetical protein
MKVRAIKLGYFKGRRYPGDTFDVPENWKAKWTEPADKSVAVESKGDEPETLGQVQKAAKQRTRRVSEEAQGE